MKKKIFAGLSLVVMAALMLSACGKGENSAPAAETATEVATEAESASTEAKIELTDDDLFDVVFADAPVNELDAQNIHIKKEKEGTTIFTFSSIDGEYAYTIDSYTGEILDKKQPEKITTSRDKTVTFDEDGIFDALAKYCPVDYAKAENLKIKKAKDLSNYEVRFSTPDGEFYYKFDAETGELLEKKEPENITDQSKVSEQDEDPAGDAISKCCDYAGISIADAENIKVKVIGKGDDVKYQVTFQCKGQDYDLVYTPSTGKVEKN